MKIFIPLISILFWAAAAGLAAAGPASLEFFYDGDCPDCQAVRHVTLADARLAFPEVAVREYDLREDAGLRRLLEWQQVLGVTDTHPVAAVLNQRVYLGGRQAIESRLLACLAELDGLAADAAAPPALPAGREDAALRFARGMGAGAVLAAGLADGINPCAFTTIIFLASLLALRGRRSAAWWFSGFCFCAGVFAAYLLLGLGILRIFTRLAAWRWLGESLRWGWAAALVLLAALSLRDAWVFQTTGRPELLRLQLPVRLRERARRLARWGMAADARTGLGLFAAGALVTLLEAPCTGQIYGPVLFYLSRQPAGARVWGLLLLYNLMFVLPPALVFALAARWQASGGRLADWGRQNVVRAKLLMAAAMLALAVLLIVF